MTPPDSIADAPHDDAARPWLSIVGIGEDGLDALSPLAKRLIADAELVVGGARHLALVGGRAKATLAWPSPLDDAFPDILARRGRPVCILATGDPFCYGIGATLLRRGVVTADDIVALPQPSAFSLAANRLGWSLPDTTCLTLHGRPLEGIAPFLQPGARLLALAWDGGTAKKLADLLTARRLGGSRLTVLEAMGGANERRRNAIAADFDLADIAALNTLAIEVVAAPGADIVPLACGIDDDLFDHDGQITKKPIRAVTLSALAPRQGEMLWDIGAGSGSVAIEWLLRHPAMHAVAIEDKPDRVARIGRNAARFGFSQLRIVAGRAPQALAGLPRPDAVFIGGGASDAGVIDAAWAALPPGGRIVINAVTLEGEAELLRRFADLGGELLRLDYARAAPIGGFRGWRPAMPVVQWQAVKP